MVLVVLGILLILAAGVGIGFGCLYDFTKLPETSFFAKMGDYTSMSILIVAGLLAAIGIVMLIIGLKKRPKIKTLQLVESALMIAVAVVLNELLKIPMPFGGGLTILSMLPIVIICHRYGTGWGLFTAFVFSLVQLIFGIKNIGYASDVVSAVGIMFLDYILAYTVIGLSGIFGKKRAGVVIGIVFSFTLRFVCHLVTGAWIWGGWMPETYWGLPMTNPWIYSALYNGWYMLAEIVLTVIVMMLLYKPLRKYLGFPAEEAEAVPETAGPEVKEEPKAE
ncbi:MAG: energy-coupled thiamine transporter ThiT [Clostridiales bacterium]|nr:energy-coupled thiamine transporter ThiT [Clostridiales bacterium]